MTEFPDLDGTAVPAEPTEPQSVEKNPFDAAGEQKKARQEYLKVLSEKYGLEKHLDYWYQEKRGIWIIRHHACLKIAELDFIQFQPPKVLGYHYDEKSRNWSCAILVVAENENKSEWAIGEASPETTGVPYPWALAEKRARDRALLKLIGAAKYMIYSDIEAQQFDKKEAPPTPGEQVKQEVRGARLHTLAARLLQAKGKAVTEEAIAKTIQYVSRFKGKKGDFVSLKLPITPQTSVKWIKSTESKLERLIKEAEAYQPPSEDEVPF